ncbi:BlaI/MecI/CopY family transcriptional regulator [Enterococcus sp. LJL98]
MGKLSISNREYELLDIFWKNDKSYTAKQIQDESPDLALSTIQTTLKKLVQKGLVKVDEIVYSGTVLSRSYVVCTSKEEFILNQYNDLEIGSLVSLFLGKQSKNNLTSEIDKIEDLLNEARNNNVQE